MKRMLLMVAAALPMVLVGGGAASAGQATAVVDARSPIAPALQRELAAAGHGGWWTRSWSSTHRRT